VPLPSDQVETVKRRCLPGIGGLNYPMLEEYDFRGDRNTPDLNVSQQQTHNACPFEMLLDELCTLARTIDVGTGGVTATCIQMA
jgi:hypothetical protein